MSMKTVQILNVENIRKDFPILSTKVNNKPLAYLDNAATSLTPESVIKAMNSYYHTYNANVHRSIHTLGEKATQEYEDAHRKVAKFINASFEEIIFTRGTTESLNVLAYSLTKKLKKGEEIVLTEMEHHSNIVPWQEYAKEKGLIIKYIKVDKDGTWFSFVTSNSKYNDLKKKFAEIIAEIKKVCENYPDSEKCVEMNSKSFEIGRDLLLKGTESAIEHLKQIIAKIEASEDVSSEDAKMRLNELNTYITSLVSLYEMVENAQTKEELKEAAIKLETLWALIKFDSKVQTLKLMNDKLEGIYNRAKSVENKLKCSLTPVSDEKEKEILINLEKYNDLLESAKEKHEKGILLLNSALRDKNFEQIEESKNLMLESYNIIKKSQGLIISIFNKIKNAGGELNACNA